MENNGYLYVATCAYMYYTATRNSIETLIDEYPEAKITLVTHKDWIENDQQMKEWCDVILTEDDGMPCHIRTKLWALPRTPYDKTLYIDCDTFIESDEIKDVFDLLGDNDMMFHKITNKVAAIVDFANNEGKLEIHGGVFTYTRKAIPFMQKWWDLYWQTRTKSSFMEVFGLSAETYEGFGFWDQTPLWYLINKTDHGLKWDWFPDNTKYNYIEMMNYRDELKRNDYCVYHYTISKQFKDDDRNIDCPKQLKGK